MQIGPAVSQAIGNFREVHGNYRSAISALTETADRQFPERSAVSLYTVKNVY